MRNGIAMSTLLHAGVMVVAIYGLPDLLDPPVEMEQPIIVELVTVAEKPVTQKPPEPKAENPPAPKLKPAAAPKPEPRPEPPEPVKKVETPPPAPKLKPAAVVMPMPPAPRKPVRMPKSPKKLALAEPQEAFRTLPRPRAKPKRPRQQFNADRIAALLDKDQRKKQTARGSITTKTQAAKPPPSPPSPARTQTRSQPMSMSEIDAIRHQIQQCWSVPAGARDAENLIVRIKVFLNSDGSLAKAPEIIGADQSDDPFYRAAAESARRAVLKCAPLKNLPADKYSRWRELTLTFNPREMLGG